MIDRFSFKEWDEECLRICNSIMQCDKKNLQEQNERYECLVNTARNYGICEKDIILYLLAQIKEQADDGYEQLKNKEKQFISHLKSGEQQMDARSAYLQKVKNGEFKPAERKDVDNATLAGLRSIGWTNAKIAKAYNVSPSFVTKRLKKFRESGGMVGTNKCGKLGL
jgi:DNA repair ATPase RecN